MGKIKAAFYVVIGIALLASGEWVYNEINNLKFFFKSCKEDISYFSERHFETKSELLDEIRHLQKQLNEIRNTTLDNKVKLRDLESK